MDGIRSIDYPLVAKTVQQALSDLIRSVVLSNLLSQDEDFGILLQFLHCVTSLQSVLTSLNAISNRKNRRSKTY
jgi:hypothetical protein